MSFRNIDNFDALTASSGRDIPTHSFVNDLAWVKGAHTLKFGANVRFSRVGTSNNVNSFHIPNANGSWVDGVGTTYMPGAGCDACGLFPAVSDGGVSSFGDTFVPLLGIISETTAYYNYDREGNVLPVGEPVRRRFATDEYEFYVQDSWKIGQTLTFSGGPSLQPVLAALRDQRPAGGAGHQARRLARDPPAADGSRAARAARRRW